MPSYKMSMRAWKKGEPEPKRVDIPVVEVPVGERERAWDLTWEELLVHGTRRTVPDGARAPKGVVWFRRGTEKDGSLQGRVLLYAQG